MQGRLPSHLWSGEVSTRNLDPTLNARPLTAFLRLTARKGTFVLAPHSQKIAWGRLTDRGHTPCPYVG